MNILMFVLELLKYVFVLGMVVAVLFLGGGMIFSLLKRRRAEGELQLPNSPEDIYQRRSEFLSESERAFYTVLASLVDTELKIFTKIRLTDLVGVKSGVPGPEYYHQAISAVRFDFVLCDPDYLKPMLVIALDDPQEEIAVDDQRRAFIEGVLRSAGMPLLRFPAKSDYTCAELEQSIVRALDHATVRPEAPKAAATAVAS